MVCMWRSEGHSVHSEGSGARTPARQTWGQLPLPAEPSSQSSKHLIRCLGCLSFLGSLKEMKIKFLLLEDAQRKANKVKCVAKI